MRRSAVRRSRQAIISTYLALVMPHLKYRVIWGSPEQVGDQQKRKFPTEDHHVGQGAGAHDRGEPKKTDFVQHGEEKEKGRPSSCPQLPKGYRETEFALFFFCETLQKEKGKQSHAVTKEV